MDSIKKGDTVKVTASLWSLSKIGIEVYAPELKKKTHKVVAIHGKYAQISGYTLPVKMLEKCEE